MRSYSLNQASASIACCSVNARLRDIANPSPAASIVVVEQVRICFPPLSYALSFKLVSGQFVREQPNFPANRLLTTATKAVENHLLGKIPSVMQMLHLPPVHVLSPPTASTFANVEDSVIARID
jgi:hypothetical protein